VWFQRLTGVRETDGKAVRAALREDGPFLVSTANGRRLRRGRLSLPSLDELRRRRDESAHHGRTTLSEVVGDVRLLHADPASAGATFQVASQFNLLEMTGPEITPEDGLERYERDHTQGPACAIACGAGTIHRNYFVPFGAERGQTATRQLDGFADLAAALGLTVDLRNGYALLTPAQLDLAASRLDGLPGPDRDALAGRLRVGIQADTEVTWHDAGHTVTQVFCSALPIAYAGGDPARWEPLARLVLDAAYEATLAAAVPVAAASGNPAVYLTLLGAGAFGNPLPWVLSALERAVGVHHAAGLDVRVVSYAWPTRELRPLLQPAETWADPLFAPTPERWGSRGDPHLWRELHAALRVAPRPASRPELAALLVRELRRLAGLDVRADDDALRPVPRYPSSGMSGGLVSPAFWRDVAVPLLLDRLTPV
jgi:hypothetical protein